MKRLVVRLDKSQLLNRLIAFFSTSLARYRGAAILAGAILTVISLVIHLIAAATGEVGWQVAAFTTLHLAIFIGLLGILFAEPLGRG